MLTLSINYFSASCLFNAITSIVLIPMILLKKPRTRTIVVFFLFLLAVAEWSVFYFLWLKTPNVELAEFFARICMIGVLLMPSLFLHFIVSLLNHKIAKYFISVNYFISLMFIVAVFTPLYLNGMRPIHFIPLWPQPGPIFGLTVAHFILVYLYTHVIMWRAITSSHGVKQNQILYVFIGTLIGGLAGATNFLSWYTLYPPIFNIFTSIYVITIAYAILRYRLMDIEIVIKKGIVYSILMTAIVGVYSFLIFVGQNIFQTTLGVNQWFAAVLTAFVIALGYKPLETFVTDLTNQYFFRKKYDYQKTLMQSSEAMNLLTDIDRLVRLITRIVTRRINLDDAITLVHDEAHHRYAVKAAEGKSKSLLGMTFSNNRELFEHLFETRKILLKDEIKNTLENTLLLPDERKRLNTIRKEMDVFHAEMCVPSISRSKYMGNKLVAVLCLGEKKSGDMYTDEDIQLLSTLSNQAAIAVENALMYSDLMKQYQELKETKDQLVQSEKLAALGTMAAGIAHEIRNPLTSLQLFVQMMAERFDDHEFRAKFSQVVPPEIERLNKIVSGLVSFAKPSKLIREPSQINDILEKTVMLSEISFKKLNVKVVKEFGEVPKVLADSQQMMQIFLNLIKNGAESMSEGGTLTVKTYFNDITGKVAVDITDTGHGISEETLKKLFSPFFTTKEGGTGLGLAITRRIIEEHQGEIKVKSKVGEGTTFTVELPVAS